MITAGAIALGILMLGSFWQTGSIKKFRSVKADLVSRSIPAGMFLFFDRLVVCPFVCPFLRNQGKKNAHGYTEGHTEVNENKYLQ